jgi:hypothetical protein
MRVAIAGMPRALGTKAITDWRIETMDAELKLEMMRMLSITAALASGLSLGVGAAIIAVVALLQ